MKTLEPVTTTVVTEQVYCRDLPFEGQALTDKINSLITRQQILKAESRNDLYQCFFQITALYHKNLYVNERMLIGTILNVFENVYDGSDLPSLENASLDKLDHGEQGLAKLNGWLTEIHAELDDFEVQLHTFNCLSCIHLLPNEGQSNFTARLVYIRDLREYIKTWIPDDNFLIAVYASRCYSETQNVQR